MKVLTGNKITRNILLGRIVCPEIESKIWCSTYTELPGKVFAYAQIKLTGGRLLGSLAVGQ